MKCEKCGGNLTLEDVVCPYCEALNEHAVEHIREMNRYKKEFETTKEEVHSVTKRYTGITVRIVIIAIVVILTVVFSLLSSEVYSIDRNRKEAKAKRNLAQTKETMEQYLEDRDYYAFHMFCNGYSISGYDEEYKEYSEIIFATRYYSYAYHFVMRVQDSKQQDIIQSGIRYIAEYLDEFYSIHAEGTAYEEAYLDVQEQLHAVLMAYCGMTQEEIDAFPEMTNAERTLILEKRLSNEE